MSFLQVKLDFTLVMTVLALVGTAEAQLPPQWPQATEGTRSAAALWAVNCSDLLGDCIAQTLPPFCRTQATEPMERSPRFVADKPPCAEDSKARTKALGRSPTLRIKRGPPLLL